MRFLPFAACAIFELGLVATLIAGCPPSSDCAVTLDCGPYEGVVGGSGAGGGGSGGLAENGAPCDDPAECASASCVDEVCCDTACDGVCEGCNVEGSEGTCAAELPGTDPAVDCEGGSCDGARACAVGDCLWSFPFGSETEDITFSVESDADGALVFGGRFGNDAGDSITFGGDPLVSAGSQDIYVAKLDAAGGHVWSYGFGAADTEVLNALAVDSTGAVVATGFFGGDLDFGGDLFTSAGSDIFVVKLDSDGAHEWSHQFGDVSEDYGYTIGVDPDDNVLVAGQFFGTVDFGDGIPRAAAGVDPFVVKLTSAGTTAWSRNYGDSADQIASAVAADASGNVIFAGYFSGSVNFGGSTLSSTMSSQDAYIVKLDPDGGHLWSRRFGDADGQSFDEIAVGPDGSIVVIGDLHGALDADGIILDGQGSIDLMIIKFDASGSVQWAKSFGDDQAQQSNGLAVDQNGNVIVSGGFRGTMDFGGGPLLSAGSYDVYVAKLAPDGTHLFSRRFGDNVEDQGGAWVAADRSGALLLAGYFDGEIDFGMGAIAAEVGAYDLFAAKLSP